VCNIQWIFKMPCATIKISFLVVIACSLSNDCVWAVILCRVHFFCRFEGKSCLYFCAEIGGRQFLRKDDNYVPYCKVSRLTRQQCEHPLPWEMQIVYFLKIYLRFRDILVRFRLCCVEWWDSYEDFILNCVKRGSGGIVEVIIVGFVWSNWQNCKNIFSG